MALTFPAVMPLFGAHGSHKIRDFRFWLERFDAIDVARSGHMTSVQMAPPLWRLHYEMAALDSEQFGLVRAFLNSLRGSQRTFYAYDIARRYPLFYETGGFAGLTRHGGVTAFDGTATYDQIGVGRDTLRIGQTTKLPSTFQLRPGDYVSLNWTVSGEERRSLHQIMETAAAVNGVVTLTVEPTLLGTVPASGACTFLKPPGIFRLDPEKPFDDPVFVNHTAVITFDAIQALYAT